MRSNNYLKYVTQIKQCRFQCKHFIYNTIDWRVLTIRCYLPLVSLAGASRHAELLYPVTEMMLDYQ